ncbi:MAG: hypothetical protein JW860_08330 [Sedimentisphaerales bacterium]|nr:hypothetical protein [Sedimentisphaerales bacterium]
MRKVDTMSEVYPSDSSILNLVAEEETGVEYIETGRAPYYLEFRRLLYRLLLATRRVNDLRVFDEGGLSVGVKAGAFRDGDQLREYPGSSGHTLADDKASIYLYLDAGGDLVLDEYTSFPDAGINHIRLAQVTTSAGDITEIIDCRGQHLWNALGGTIYGGSCRNYTSQGGVSFIFQATVSAGETVVIHNSNAPFKYRVLDAWSVANGVNGGSWKLDDGANDITVPVTLTLADKAVDRTGSLDNDYAGIEKDGSLRVVGDGASADCDVYVLCMRVE